MRTDRTHWSGTQLNTRITLLTALLVSLLTGAGSYYWVWILEPALRNDAQSSTRFQSQAMANLLGDVLAPGIGTAQLDSVAKVMDGMLLFEHPSTQHSFLRRIELEFDPDLVDLPPEQAVFARGDPECRSCFEAEVPVYAANTRELIAIARFYASDEFFRNLRDDVQARLLQALGVLLVLLALFWWLLTHLLRPLREIAVHVQARDIAELRPLPPLGRGISAEIRMIKEALDGLLAKSREYTASLQESRDLLARQSRERAELIDELENKNAELERFTYTVSHDLKSPLITIRGFVGLLQSDLQAQNEDRVTQDLQQIAAAADNMQTLLEELLELSRIGRIVNPSEWVDMGELVEEALAMVAGRIEAHEVQVSVAPGAPKAFGDRKRLLEVLLNLIDNAAKFVGTEARPQVDISFEDHPTEVVCHVMDNGPGIEPRYHDMVFGLFDRLDPTTEGTGIGLALVKRIIEVHGGRIWLDSEGKDRGCRFSFALPKPKEVSE